MEGKNPFPTAVDLRFMGKLRDTVVAVMLLASTASQQGPVPSSCRVL